MAYTCKILLGRITKASGYEGAVTVKLERSFIGKIPEMESAVVAFQGRYNRIGAIISYIYHWIIENGYRISGKPFNIYYISPGNEIDPDNFVTEICYPIKKYRSGFLCCQ